MLGIEDKYVVAAYILSILVTLLCIIYGIICWNKGEEAAKAEDIQWAKEEKKVEDEL